MSSGHGDGGVQSGGQHDPANRRTRRQLAGVLVLMAALVALGVYPMLSDDEEPSQDATGPSTAAPPTATLTPPAPSADATAGESAPPTEAQKTHQPSNRQQAREAIEEVMVPFAEATPSTDDGRNEWEDSLHTNSATDKFRQQARRQFLHLYGGAIQQDVATTDAKVSKAKQLWMRSKKAVWRVTIKRRVVPTPGNPAPASTEKVTWDVLLVKSDGRWRVDVFAAPSPQNANPKNFKVVRGG